MSDDSGSPSWLVMGVVFKGEGAEEFGEVWALVGGGGAVVDENEVADVASERLWVDRGELVRKVRDWKGIGEMARRWSCV